jgi:hypothetical protein
VPKLPLRPLLPLSLADPTIATKRLLIPSRFNRGRFSSEVWLDKWRALGEVLEAVDSG